MNPQDLARPEILALKPYVSARSGAAADGVLLNANEAPASLLDDPAFAALDLNRYPSPQPHELRDRLASLYGVAADQLLITRGSDEGIDLLTRVFCRAGQDAILETPPCFGMYRIAAGIQGARVVAVPRVGDDFALDIDGLLAALDADPGIRLLYLTSPNNPTGDLLPGDTLDRLLAACDGRALVVMDEAYIEFCDIPSAASRVSEAPHLVVLRTLSKAYAAAGLRCGAVIADPAVIDLLGRVMAPYPLTAPAVAAALAVTTDEARRQQAAMLAELATQKTRLVERLRQTPWVEALWPGEANFVLVRVDQAPDLVAHCAANGVRIRDFSTQPGLAGCVRLTIGSAGDMQALGRALDTWTPAP